MRRSTAIPVGRYLFVTVAMAVMNVTAQVTQPSPTAPQNRSLPGGSILLGLAEDGLPLLLNVYDPTPGPILIAGDQGIGKTSFLKWLAYSSSLFEPGDIQFGVVTPFPEEWNESDLPNGLGIWPADIRHIGEDEPCARGQRRDARAVRDRAGHVVATGHSGGPIILASLPSGHYSVRATYDGNTITRSVNVRSSRLRSSAWAGRSAASASWTS